MATLDDYRAGAGAIPKRMLKWRLYGAGLDKLQLEEVDVPCIRPDELLVRQDACGLCFSDTKVISLGQAHPRMVGRDMERNPVTLGHEVTCTVVAVGDRLQDRFRVGDRFIVQADVFHDGVSMAYGYVISGGLSEYSVIPKEMIFGDEGCYLLPLRSGDGYVETALVEPWACVVAAYALGHRRGVKPNGNVLILAGRDAELDWDGATAGEAAPSAVYVVGEGVSALQSAATGLVDPDRVCALQPPAAWKDLLQYTSGAGFDDIVVAGAVSPEDVEGAATALANHGVLSFIGAAVMPRKLSLDIGRIHYNWHHYVGAATSRVADAYAELRGAELKAGGVAWFIGAGGPMGQMHVQRAVQIAEAPLRIVATDIDAARLQSVVDRFGAHARERGIDLVAINPKDLSPEAFDARLRELTGGRGFDDVVSLVPVPALIEHATAFLADGAWFNVFAGVARGTMADIDVNAIRERGVRYVGSSGSAISDMRTTLEKVESGELATNASLAAVGGMRAAREGLAAVKDGRYPGKAVVLPLIHDMPLTALPDLRELYPTVHAKLTDGMFWTIEAEKELLRVALLDKENGQ